MQDTRRYEGVRVLAGNLRGTATLSIRFIIDVIIMRQHLDI